MRLLNHGMIKTRSSSAHKHQQQQQQQQQRDHYYSRAAATPSPQYEYLMEPGRGGPSSNQYVRVKAVKNNQHQFGASAVSQPPPLPVHLRDLTSSSSSSPAFEYGSAKSSKRAGSGVRKLGMLRNNHRLREEDDLYEKLLFKNHFLATQMTGYVVRFFSYVL